MILAHALSLLLSLSLHCRHDVKKNPRAAAVPLLHLRRLGSCPSGLQLCGGVTSERNASTSPTTLSRAGTCPPSHLSPCCDQSHLCLHAPCKAQGDPNGWVSVSNVKGKIGEQRPSGKQIDMGWAGIQAPPLHIAKLCHIISISRL